VDSGEDDLTVACVEETLCFVESEIRGLAGGIGAYVRDDAVGTEGVAAVLDFEEGAGACGVVGEGVGQRDGLGGWGMEVSETAQEIVFGGEDVEDAREFAEGLGSGPCATTGDEDGNVGVPAVEGADGLSRFSVGAVGDGAGVDDDGVESCGRRGGEPVEPCEILAQEFAFVLVNLAAEGEELEAIIHGWFRVVMEE